MRLDITTCTVGIFHYLVALEAATLEDETRIIKNVIEKRALFASTDPRTNRTIEINFIFYPLFIMGLDEQRQVLTSSGWIDFWWYDPRLAWNESEYGGIHRMYVKRKFIWIPDLQVENSVKPFTILGSEEDFLLVRSSGKVEWSAGDIYQTVCEVDVGRFPFDNQYCFLNISSWMYYTEELKLMYTNNSINMDFYKPNSEWTLLSLSVSENSYDYVGQSSQDALSFNFRLKRHSAFYVLKIITPTVILSVLNSFVFIVPPESGEKVSMSVTTMLSLTVFLSYIGDVTPNNSESIPIIALFVVLHLALGALSIISNIVILDMHYKAKTGKMSASPRTVFFPTLLQLIPIRIHTVTNTETSGEKPEANPHPKVKDTMSETERREAAMKRMRSWDIFFFFLFLFLSMAVTTGCVMFMLL